MTNDAPDPAIAQDPWEHIDNRLAALEHRIRQQGAATLAATDAHLARLAAIRRTLATDPWPPPTPTPTAAPAATALGRPRPHPGEERESGSGPPP
ncbi:hypothetical protein AB0K51_13170 [Kitasatospora sp. NPDC049285]|uniref:hypothetical protein n=1 Tax=Kitasatospora sp. NPDC049285 TaxID=3157096 RepID=UPI003439483C